MGERDRKIRMMREEDKLSFDEIGDRLGISGPRARDLFMREKEREGDPMKRLHRKVLGIIERETGLRNPGLMDVKSFLARLNEESAYGWEQPFMRFSRSGRHAVALMREFATEFGLLPPKKEPARDETGHQASMAQASMERLGLYSRLAIQRYTGKESPSVEDLRTMLQELQEAGGEKGWKASFLGIEMGNMRSRKEIEALAASLGILPGEAKN